MMMFNCASVNYGRSFLNDGDESFWGTQISRCLQDDDDGRPKFTVRGKGSKLMQGRGGEIQCRICRIHGLRRSCQICVGIMLTEI